MSLLIALVPENWELWRYKAIQWDYLDKQWWMTPIEFIIIIYCFIGFHSVSSLRLLPSLDAFCRKWNISHHAAQPTIYALGAAAPIIILSNVACALDMFHQTENAHKLGICSIIGFGLATTSLIPSFSVFSLFGIIVLPKYTTIRDHMFIIILLSMFLTIILSGEFLWWKSTIIGTIYIFYLFYIILYPKIKDLCIRNSNPLETNRLLSKLQEHKTTTTSHLSHSQIDQNQSFLDQSYQKIEYDEQSEKFSPFDSTTLLKSTKNMNNKPQLQSNLNENLLIVDTTCSNHSNSNMSPDRKSMQSNGTSIASIARHPMLLNEYEEDLTGYPSDIEEYENESASAYTNNQCRTEEQDIDDNAESVNKIMLLTPKYQENVYHIYPTIKFESLNQHNLDSSKSYSNNMDKRKSKLRSCLIDAFKICNRIYDIMSIPVQILIKFTIPSNDLHSKCECLYPLSFLLSIIWIIIFSFMLIVILYHWSQIFSFKLSIIGIVYIGPIATLPNIIDGITLSLQGFAS
eukprot:344978_1